jgi:hypothetical protein
MDMGENRWARRLMWVVWPAFLVAGLLEMLVFAMVDPQDLHWAGQPLELSRQGIYTVAFFVFWVLTLLACSLTALLAMSPQEVNRPEIDSEAVTASKPVRPPGGPDLD